ncbi:MAG: sugar nucleotide-binding protein, partial [Sneathiella sp.]|nr:sugar nucleotide-binding protein [Sneathiella sp.]
EVLKPEFNSWGIFHYCGGPAVSWYEFACEILKDETHITVSPIPSADYPTPAKRPHNSVLDCTKIRSVFSVQQPNWKGALSQWKEKE